MTDEFRCYGPPGTGKTTWLAKQAKLAADKYGPSGVVIASLTRAAAAEIAGRDTTIPKENVGTLHSHAFHALGRPGIAESKEGLEDWNKHAPSFRDRLGKGKVFDPENPQIDSVIETSDADIALAQMSMNRQRMMPRELWAKPVQRFAKRWDEWKERTGRLDFTDLIERAIEKTERHHLNPAVFLLDEAQDMSRLEMTLARKWGAHAHVFVIVGDPWQNLYQWRGSDPEAFTAGEVSGVKILDQSYRVPAKVQKYAVDFLQPIVGDHTFPEYKPRDEPGEVIVSPYTWAFPGPILRDFEEDIERGRTVMLLASCGYMLNPAVKMLRERGIPFHNPYRLTHGGWNPMRYSDRVLAFLKPSKDAWGAAAGVWSLEDLEKWTDVLAVSTTMTRGAKAAIAARIAEMESKPAFMREALQEPLKLERVFSFFKEEAREPIFNMDLDWLQANTRDSRRRVIDYPVEVAKQYGVEALREVPKIIIGTIHSVKGGEADSVYVLPDLSSQGMDSYRSRGSARDSIYRQYYVAFTRARQKLVLLAPHGSDRVQFPRPKGSE